MVLLNGLLFSDLILSPTHGMYTFLVYSNLNLSNILSIKLICEIVYSLLLFSTFIPRIKFMGSDLDTLKLFLIIFVTFSISSSVPVTIISSTYRPIILINLLFFFIIFNFTINTFFRN